MNANLEAILADRFPLLYSPAPEERSFQLLGFECSDGWFGLLSALSTVLSRRGGQLDPEFQITHVRETFGSLRFYAYASDEFSGGAIGFAEAMSLRLSERSGRPGFPCRVGNWYCTLAPDENKDALLTFRPDVATRSIAQAGPYAAMAATKSARSSVAIRAPSGYADVIDQLLTFLKEPGGGALRVVSVTSDPDVGLTLQASDLTDAHLGAIACAAELCRSWVNPGSGATGPVNEDGVSAC